jgi:hypothetical protein
MARLKNISPTLNSLAAKLVHQRLQLQDREDTGRLRATVERLIARGVPVDQLLHALSQQTWESQLARQLQAVGLAE